MRPDRRTLVQRAAISFCHIASTTMSESVMIHHRRHDDEISKCASQKNVFSARVPIIALQRVHTCNAHNARKSSHHIDRIIASSCLQCTQCAHTQVRRRIVRVDLDTHTRHTCTHTRTIHYTHVNTHRMFARRTTHCYALPFIKHTQVTLCSINASHRMYTHTHSMYMYVRTIYICTCT